MLLETEVGSISSSMWQQRADLHEDLALQFINLLLINL